MTLFATILLATIVAWLLLSPHLRPRSAENYSLAEGALQALQDQRERCVQLLKDLDLDFSTGKVGDGDYKRMRGSLEVELGQILTRIDECKVG